MRALNYSGHPAKREQRRKGESLLKSVRQLIESVNDTLKEQLEIEQYGGRTFEGVASGSPRTSSRRSPRGLGHKTGAPPYGH
ncbi:hypothetical protein [Streptomyces sp. NPDC095817]|uniref:hypothetical protein n=1 Tax=Streptomyces sp. NPDC095817 TaxID=3155082 RepID=UPI003325D6FE